MPFIKEQFFPLTERSLCIVIFMQNKQPLLLVDDDSTALQLMKEILEDKQYKADTAGSVEQALESLKKTSYKVIISDIKMPGKSGMDLLSLCIREYPEIPVILITGHGTIKNAVEALKTGAFEYLSKPVQMDELLLVIEKAIAHQQLVTKNSFLQSEINNYTDFLYSTKNRELESVYKRVQLIRNENTSVFIQGESGTGKEVIARLIHNSGVRQSGNFVAINCGAIPEELIISELFGYEKGAFTGADKKTMGKLELADGGTLFLDEVNELPPRAQVALLRFIQEKEITPLGSTRRKVINVRIITATNSDLWELVQEGEFREDLYYRINVLPLQLPPLRERRDDITELAEWFLKRLRKSSGRLGQRFSENALETMKNYHWPGNIRELRNVVDRASIICSKKLIEAPDLLLTHNSRKECSEMDPFEILGIKTLKEIEDDYISWVIDQFNGNRTRASQALGISARGLRYKLNNGQ